MSTWTGAGQSRGLVQHRLDSPSQTHLVHESWLPRLALLVSRGIALHGLAKYRQRHEAGEEDQACKNASSRVTDLLASPKVSALLAQLLFGALAFRHAVEQFDVKRRDLTASLT